MPSGLDIPPDALSSCTIPLGKWKQTDLIYGTGEKQYGQRVNFIFLPATVLSVIGSTGFLIQTAMLYRYHMAC